MKEKVKFANHELVALSLFLLGGDAGPVDLEHIAVKVNELAPGVFTWKKYASQINLEIVRVILLNLKRDQERCCGDHVSL